MSSYAAFAEYYDALMRDVDYPAYADYLGTLLQRLHHDPGIVLDLACGTGSLTLELAERGMDVYGIDGSPEMLSIAQRKAAERGRQILFLCQKMQRIDLYGTIHTVFCVLDSINHLPSASDVAKTFQRVSLFLEPGGYFIFDVNSLYKHEMVLGDHAFLYDTDAVFCAWQNQYDPATHTTEITLDFFAAEGTHYVRQTEQFRERAYLVEELEALLTAAGLRTVAVYEALTFEAPKADTQRLLFVAQK